MIPAATHNETIDLLCRHRSDRAFTSDPIDAATLDMIVNAAHRGPTSINAQHVSLIVVQDPARRARIAEIAGGQPWIAKAPVFIAVVMDFNKTALGVDFAGKQQIIHESLEGYTAAAVDAGIALANLLAAARSYGLGVVPIGGIRRDPQAMIALLELPRLTFPVAGMCIGHIETPSRQKPRLPLSTFRHDEVYRLSGMDRVVAGYDRDIETYWQSIGRQDGQCWSRNTASFYERIYFPQTVVAARSQGFGFEK